MDRILRFLQEHEEEMLEDLRLFVEQETPSTEKKLLDDFARFLADYAATVGGRAEILPAVGSGDHVRIRWDDEGSGPPIFLLGHYDTVWAEGTIKEMPFGVRGDIATGPGVFDMKCGLVQSFWAVKTAREVLGVHKPIVFLCNSDEEISSPGSRTLIEAEARRAAAVLVRAKPGRSAQDGPQRGWPLPGPRHRQAGPRRSRPEGWRERHRRALQARPRAARPLRPRRHGYDGKRRRR